jgi:hypothetical protein
MAFIHGKSALVLQNEFDLSAYFNDISISRSIETAETTAFGASAKAYIVGLIDGTLSLSGMFDGAANAIDAEMTDVLGVNAGAVISASVSGVTTIGTRMISTTGKLHQLAMLFQQTQSFKQMTESAMQFRLRLLVQLQPQQLELRWIMAHHHQMVDSLLFM